MTTFIDFARVHGVEVNPAALHPKDRVQRCGTTAHPRSKNGAYFWDGQRGWVFAWDGEARVHWFADPNARPWSEQEKRAWQQRREAARHAEEHRRRKAAQTAAALLREAKPGRHDYLFRKGFPQAEGLVLPDGALLVPMRDWQSNELRGVQTIRWTDTQENPGHMQWVKKMTFGMKARGAVLRFGTRHATETVYCEGYATGLSIEAAVRQLRLNAAVLVCFSDSNMAYVAQQTNGRRYCYADNDASGAGERAAKEAGLPYCMSDTVGHDANDDHQRYGLVAVCKKLMEARMRC